MLSVALLQLGIYRNDISKAIDWGEKLTRFAARRGARLVCFPEHWLLSTIFPPENEVLARFSRLARQLNIYVNLGAYYERRKKGIFLTSVMVSPDGKDFFRQDKVHLYGRERRIASPGSGFKICLVEGFRVGVLVCHDAVFPEAARVVTKAGADLLIIPSLIKASGMEPWLCYLRARALENRVPIVAPNVYHPPVFLGGSCVVDLEYDKKENVMYAIIKKARRGVTTITTSIDLTSKKALRIERLKELRPDAYHVE